MSVRLDARAPINQSMAAKGLSAGGEQMSLFSDASDRKHEQLDRVVDRIVDRFGKSAVRRGMSREGDDRDDDDDRVFGKD